MPEKEVIKLENLSRTFEAGGVTIHALRPTSLSLKEKDFVTIMGPSGAGKSTMLNIFGLLTKPTDGTYILNGQNVSNLSDSQTAEARCKSLGIVFQSFNLLPHLTVMENICVPMQYAKISRKNMLARGNELLKKVGLENRSKSMPNQLSGGQCQRVAIARALANNPPVILADEPTGNLDEKTGLEIMKLFQELNNAGKTIIMVTHNPGYKKYATRPLWIHDGNLCEHSDEIGFES